MNCSLFIEGDSRFGIPAGAEFAPKVIQNWLESRSVDLLGYPGVFDDLLKHGYSFRRPRAEQYPSLRKGNHGIRADLRGFGHGTVRNPLVHIIPIVLTRFAGIRLS